VVYTRLESSFSEVATMLQNSQSSRSAGNFAHGGGGVNAALTVQKTPNS